MAVAVFPRPRRAVVASSSASVPPCPCSSEDLVYVFRIVYQASRVSASNGLHALLYQPLEAAVRGAQQRVDLCSPFVTADVATLLARIASTSPARWRLLTKLSPASVAHGSLDIDGLRRLRDAGVEVRHLDHLHAKVFLIDDALGYLGSANLTSSGLGSHKRPNFELSVALDAPERANVDAALSTWHLSASLVTDAMFDECEALAARTRVAALRKIESSQQQQNRERAADEILEQSLVVTVWVKAEYRTSQEAEQAYGPDAFVGTTKVGRPSFAVGEILLIYATGPHVCNRIVEVKKETRLDRAFQVAQGVPAADAERWPWVTPVWERLLVPVANGVRLERLGLSGQWLRRSHCRMPVGGLAAAIATMLG
jgi:hypothetical protein